MDSALAFSIMDPEAVRVQRVLHPMHGDRIVTTIEFEYEDETRAFEVAYPPDEFMGFLIASLNALGFGESDLEYLAERYTRDFQ